MGRTSPFLRYAVDCTPREWPNYKAGARGDSSQAAVGKRCRLRRELNTLQAMANDLGFEINLDAIRGEADNDNAQHSASLRRLFRLSADTHVRVRRSRRRHIAGANSRVAGASTAVGPPIQYPFVRAVTCRAGWRMHGSMSSRRSCTGTPVRVAGCREPGLSRTRGSGAAWSPAHRVNGAAYPSRTDANALSL